MYLIDLEGIDLVVSDDQIVVGEHTDLFVAGGATFLNEVSGEVPVSPSVLIVSSTGTGWDITDVNVYSGSGDDYPASPTGSPIATVSSPADPKEVIITSFSGVPNYDPDDDGYWLWVVIDVVDGAASRTYNSKRFMTLVKDKAPSTFQDEDHN